MDRRDFLRSSATGLATSLLVPGALAHAAAPARRRPPNIVLILADDQGYADCGIQGCRDIPTPHIDSIAASGVRFTSGYVSCPLCSPTRAGLMTGRYQQRFGHEFNPGPESAADPHFGLPITEVTLAERLKPLGYATGMFGKWHLGFQPELQPPKRGFDEFFGFLGGAHAYVPGGTGELGAAILRGTEPAQETEYLTDAFAREAVSFIDRHREHPFFLYLPFNAVHAPLQAIDQYLARFAAIKDGKRRLHAAQLSAMDDGVGRVLAKLRETNLDADTLLFYLSDNGGPTPQTTSSNAPLHGYKGQVYEGGIRIPFMMRWTGRLPAGKVYEKPVISLDIHPTAVAAAGEIVEAGWGLDGLDLVPYLTGEDDGAPHETLCWRMGANQRAIRYRDRKLLWCGGEDPEAELYDLATDPGETRDLAKLGGGKGAELLEQTYRQWDAQMIDPKWKWGGGGRASGRAGQRFQQLDRNGDGKLTPDELPRPQLFRRLDTNQDGAITPEEARAALGSRPTP